MSSLWAVVCIMLASVPKCEAVPVVHQIEMAKCMAEGDKLADSFVTEILPQGRAVAILCIEGPPEKGA